jgi:hypothetical protein
MRTIALVALLSSLAAAQPMMMNPAQMSGIPRPDPAVPKSTLTVRLIRGQLSNRITNHEVTLLDGAQREVATEKTDTEGRATFKNLGAGPYVARAIDGTETLVSQPIDMPPEVGVRVMLVFAEAKKGESGAAAPAPTPTAEPTTAARPDGSGRPDKSLPKGTLVVHVEDSGTAVPGLEVVVGEGKAGENKIAEHRGTTNAEGDMRFDGLTADAKTGYLATVVRDGARFAGKPFRLVDNMGSRVVLDVRPVSHDGSGVQIGRGSHFVLEIVDEGVQVGEVWRLQNLSSSAIDVPGGIRIPLPAGALSAQVGPGQPPTFSISKDGKSAVWNGPLPVGDTELQVFFGMPYSGDTLELQQNVTVPFTEVNVVTERVPGLNIEGDFLDAQEKPFGPKMLVVYYGKSGAARGSTIRFSARGLPHADSTWRLWAAFVAVVLFVGLLVWGLSGRGQARRETVGLEGERAKLFEELRKLDDLPKHSKKQKSRRKELVDRLAQVYREIDEAQG